MVQERRCGRLKFHHKTQDKDSVEQLEIELQRLANLERKGMLKGHFFQALHMMWQRKLGAPKPDEIFS